MAVMAIELYEHNMTAYRSAIKLMDVTGKAAVIHPTGTGKSFIGFKLAEDNPDKRILWLTPSEYIVKTQLENLRKEGGSDLTNISFVTYTKLMLMSEEEISALKPEYCIMDEFHRGGASSWSVNVQYLIEAYPDMKLLGLSATHIRYLDNQRDMAEELFDGNIASEMTLGEAIVRGILLPPKYVISVYGYQEELRKYEDRVDRIVNTGIRDKNRAELDAFRKALEMADGLDKVFDKNMENRQGKYIVFCSNKTRMEEMASHAVEWFGRIDPDMHIYKVYSEDPTASQDFIDFKADNTDRLKLLFCIDMLNEGVHVEDIDGVILFRPTVSPIIYKQQIGRALSANKKKKPVIFDVVNNFENLYSISSLQEEIDLAVSYYRDLGESDSIACDGFEIIDETCDCRRLFENLERSLASTWEVYFRAAQAYYNEHGDLQVPKRYITDSGLALGTWIIAQRRVYSGKAPGSLTEAQIMRLEGICMCWDNVKELEWQRAYEHAKEYYETYGDLDVKVKYVCGDGFRLGSWIANTRTAYQNRIKQSLLTPERIKLLESIGMIWGKNNALWERNYAAAKEYYEKHGDLRVRADYVTEDGIRLGTWIGNQKKIYSGVKTAGAELSEEQIARLEAIGMEWEGKFELQWRGSYMAACEYFRERGDLNVPVAYRTKDGIMLGKWIRRQRSQYAKGKLLEDKVKKLDRIGMCWQSARRNGAAC